MTVRLNVLMDDLGDAIGDEVGDGVRDGPRFLLVHGLASNARLWDGVRASLGRRGFPSAAVDLRGHGLSEKPDDGYDFETIADDLVGVLDRLGWDNAFLAGQSWGGNVVLETAARHPSLVRGVACIDGGWIDLSTMGPWEEVAARMAPPRLEGRRLEEMERWHRQAHGDWPESGIQGALACFEVLDDGTIRPWLTRERHMTILRHLFENEPVMLYPRVEAPVLLAPCDDGGDPAWLARKRAAVETAERLLPRWRTVWFDAHHDVHAQKPDEVASLLIAAATEPGFFD